MAETDQEKSTPVRSRGKAASADLASDAAETTGLRAGSGGASRPGAAPVVDELGGRSFEDAMRELDGIVGRLEQGSQPLEQSLRDFESGVALLRGLHRKLSEVEERVEVLLRDADGVLRTRDGGELAR